MLCLGRGNTPLFKQVSALALDRLNGVCTLKLRTVGHTFLMLQVRLTKGLQGKLHKALQEDS